MADEDEVRVLVVTGVSGSGKTTVGSLLAKRLDWDFADADQFHPPANVAKMRAGTPLTEADRRSFLEGIAAWIDEHLAAGTPGVVTCSALKRAYRDGFRRPGVHMIHLHGDPELIARRMAGRKGHFFPPKLLKTQLEELEPPGPDEQDVLTVSVAGTPEETVRQIVDALALTRRPS